MKELFRIDKQSRSLKELGWLAEENIDLLLSWSGLAEPGGKLCLDLVSCTSERWGVCGRRGAEIDTVTAVVAINKDGKHILLSGGGVLELAHASPLPGVLNSVREHDVCAGDIETAVLLDVEVNLGVTDVPAEAKDRLAHGDPVSVVDEAGSQWVLGVRDLEPGELGAVLPGPLSHVVLAVHLGV